MKKLLFTFILALLAATGAWAETFTVGNLQYNILDASAKTVEVVNPVEEVVGRLVIPSTVSYNGTDYIVEALGYGSFYNAKKVTELVLPHTIKLVNDLSFFNCPKMEKLTVLAVNPPSYSDNLFPDLEYSRAPVFVPAESLEKYKKTSWAVFNLQAIPKMKFIIADEAAKTVELDGCEPEPEGVLDIPATTVIDGKEYRVTSIGNDAFRDCTKITEVIIPESVTVIARYAFYGCSALTKVTIPESVTTIGIYAFSYTGITEVTLPDSLTKIEAGLFNCSTHLYKLTIGENVTEIGDYAFSYNNLYEMTILANIPPTLGKYVFWNISNTVVVYVPFGTSEAYKAAAGWKDFKNIRELPLIVDNLIYAITDAKAAEVIGYETEPAGVLNIPATITHNDMDYSVESIAESAFKDCSSITKVTVPNSVTTIGDYAFQGCTSCVVLILGESVENIGVGAFATCNVLKEMTVLATVPPVTGAEVFFSVDRKIPVYVPAKSLEAYKTADVWKEFTNLQAILVNEFTVGGMTYEVIDHTAKTVEVINFTDELPSTVTVPATVSYEGKNYTVTAIASKAFFENKTITEITISEGITSIGEYTFGKCFALTTVNIPASLTNMGDWVFDACTALTQINVNEGNTAYSSENGILFNKDKTTLLCYPARKPGTDYTIPSSVTVIGKNAFSNCDTLIKLTIPAGVTTIEDYAFYFCTSLAEMTVLATVPPTITDEGVFYCVDNSIPVYVPAESLTAYQTADFWEEFSNLQAISGTAIDTPSMPESISIQGGMLHNPQGLTVSIYDLTGRLVYSGNATTVELPAGIYVVSCNGASCKAVF